MRGLIIDDDRDVAEILRDELADHNIQLDIEGNGAQGLQRALKEKYDFILLDMVLPVLSGSEICKQIRKQNEHTPIVMITSKDGEAQKVALLELGADDYITKPFSLAEVIARLKAILRRTQHRNDLTTTDSTQQYHIQDLLIDTSTWTVSRAGEEISLTVYEFEILACLAASAGKPVSRERLIEHLQGSYVAGYEHSLTTAINRLRSKLEREASEPQYIKTVRSLGYTLAK